MKNILRSLKMRLSGSSRNDPYYMMMINDPVLKERCRDVLALNDEHFVVKTNTEKEDERGLPGLRRYKTSGWYQVMLGRYGFATDYCRGMDVLDSCSGLGWGAYLIEPFVKSLSCIELDPKAVENANKMWNYESAKFHIGSVLKMPFEDNSFDRVIAMETMEHFTLEDAQTYRDEIYRVLRPGGMLIGSTPLPVDQSGVDDEQKNPYHLHVFLRTEILPFLNERFSASKLMPNHRFFTATKSM